MRCLNRRQAMDLCNLVVLVDNISAPQRFPFDSYPTWIKLIFSVEHHFLTEEESSVFGA